MAAADFHKRKPVSIPIDRFTDSGLQVRAIVDQIAAAAEEIEQHLVTEFKNAPAGFVLGMVSTLCSRVAKTKDVTSTLALFGFAAILRVIAAPKASEEPPATT